MDQAQRNSRIIYAKLAATLTPEELRLLFAIKSGLTSCVWVMGDDAWHRNATVSDKHPTITAVPRDPLEVAPEICTLGTRLKLSHRTGAAMSQV